MHSGLPTLSHTSCRGWPEQEGAQEPGTYWLQPYTRVLDPINSLAPTPLFPTNTPPTYILSGIDASNVSCSICTEVYRCPVQLQCGTLVCAACCSQWVQVSAGVSCPCCFAHQLDDTNIQPPTSVVSDLLGSLWVECTAEGCTKVVKARNLRKHLKSGCKHYSETSTDSPSRVSLRDILSQPMTTPTTPAEKMVLRSFFRREEASNPHRTVTVETAGQVLYTHATLFTAYIQFVSVAASLCASPWMPSIHL